MRILVISTPIFKLGSTGLPGYGGLEQIAWLCAKGLAEKGHQVSLVSPEGSCCPNVEIISIGPERSIGEAQAYEIYKGKLNQFDVIISHDWNKYSYLAKMEGRCKPPILGVCHAPINTMYQTLPNVDKPCFVCISQDQANHFRAVFERDCRFVYNGIDLGLYKSMKVKRSNRYLFLARFSSIKGPKLAIDACKEAGVGLDLVGDTSITNEPEYFEQCKKAADGEQIKIIGPCSRAESVWWYSQAHAFLHPIRDFREPMGLAPVEAMACECPVISWKRGALSETVGDAGILVTSFEQLVNAIRETSKVDYFFANNFRMRAREQSEKFSIERMVQSYNDLCYEAVNGGW